MLIMRLNRNIWLVLMVSILATLACSLQADVPTPTAEPELTPLIRITQQPTRTPFPEDTEEPAADNDDGSTTNSGSSNSGNNSGSSGTGSVVTGVTYIPNCTPRADWTNFYTVVRGDTLAAIARRVNSNFQTLAQGNCIANPNAIEVGQVLRLPGTITVPQPQPIIFVDTPADVPINTSGGINIVGRTQNVNSGSTVKVQLLNANGVLVREQFTSTTGSYGIVFTVGSVSGYPGANNQGAPASIRAFALDGSGNTVASTGKNVFLRTNDVIDPKITLDIDSVNVDSNARRLTASGNGGRGLFEGNVVVRLLDANGTILREAPTTVVYRSNTQSEGEWSLAFDVDNLTTLGQGQVFAFHPSARDGSIVVSDSRAVSFDFTPDIPDVSIDIRLGEYDPQITPKADGTFLIQGFLSDASVYNTVNVAVRDTNNNTLSGTARSTTANSSGNWNLTMQVPIGTRGNHQIYAYVTNENGNVVADDVKTIPFAEDLGTMSRVFNGDAYTITYPDGWFQSANGNAVVIASFSTTPPGAAWNENTAEIGITSTPKEAETTLDTFAAGYQSANAALDQNFQLQPFAFNDGSSGLMFSFVGGTGKQIYIVFKETDTHYITVSANGNWELNEPIIKTLR